MCVCKWWLTLMNHSCSINNLRPIFSTKKNSLWISRLTASQLTWWLLMIHCVHHSCLSRMEDQDRVSQASSSATVSFLPIRDKVNHIHIWTNTSTCFKPTDTVCVIMYVQSHERVQTFGKRCQAAKRDPNCPVVIRGWLYKRVMFRAQYWPYVWDHDK